MKITHLNSSNIHGGSGRAAYRIHSSLKKLGINSRMFAMRGFGSDLDVKVVSNKRVDKFLQKVRLHYEKQILNKYRNREEKIFSVASKGLNVTREKFVRNADIINFHWTNKCFLSLKSIEQIVSLGKPIVWTIHDMWAFTGGCHYSGDCNKYEEKCGKCPHLHSTKSNDLSREILSRKARVFEKLNLTIVAPSIWLAECAKKSSLFRKNKIEVIPYPIDTKIFKPVEKGNAREILNISNSKHLLLFGMSSKADIKRKGVSYLMEALLILNHNFPKLSEEIELAVFGVPYSEKIVNIPFKTHFLGALHDDFTIDLCYNAADIFILPSIEDNLPNTTIESLACGTPVVGFNVGGIPDMITHKKNGYIAEYKSAEDLARGIAWVLEDKNRLKDLGKNAREKVLNNYTYEIIGNKYLTLYDSLLKP